MTPLAGWENFYVIVGSSAGALIGLQFVVMSLIANMPIGKDHGQAGAAFATPTIMHFCAVLLLAAVQTAPWPGVIAVAIAWGSLGLAGTLYTIVVASRMQTQKIYAPVFEDWLCHGILPFAAYTAIALSAIIVRSNASVALFLTGAAVLLILFIGIHNAWDAITYHIYYARRGPRDKEATKKIDKYE